jgi:UDP-N-acetyl-D-mannosaminuronic acid dehydrogenase
MKQKIVIMGLGYIGLPTAALLAGKQNQVIGVDINQRVVDTINKGQIHIVEPDLEGLVNFVVGKGLLKATTYPEAADIFIIAVPTPFKENHLPDISYVRSSVLAIIPYLKANDLVILESTCPVGTTEEMYQLIISERPELDAEFYMCYCPERVLPGKIIFELENNDRVIGGITTESTQKAIDFYNGFVKGNLHPTNSRTAEMCKLAENSSRDVQIAFANELSIICEKSGINVWELIQLANNLVPVLEVIVLRLILGFW